MVDSCRLYSVFSSGTGQSGVKCLTEGSFHRKRLTAIHWTFYRLRRRIASHESRGWPVVLECLCLTSFVVCDLSQCFMCCSQLGHNGFSLLFIFPLNVMLHTVYSINQVLTGYCLATKSLSPPSPASTFLWIHVQTSQSAHTHTHTFVPLFCIWLV